MQTSSLFWTEWIYHYQLWKTNILGGAERFPHFFMSYDTSIPAAVRPACCVLAQYVVHWHRLIPECPTRPASAGLFLFRDFPKWHDTSIQVAPRPSMFCHVPNGLAHSPLHLGISLNNPIPVSQQRCASRKC